jgi:hypothetical protein
MGTGKRPGANGKAVWNKSGLEPFTGGRLGVQEIGQRRLKTEITENRSAPVSSEIQRKRLALALRLVSAKVAGDVYE